MDKAPRVIGFGEIERVTYYRWLHLRQCALKGAIEAVKLDGPLPQQVPTRATLIGRFHHRAMELAASAGSLGEFVEEIDAEIIRLQATADQWPHLRKAGSVSGWDEVNRSASLARRVVSGRGMKDAMRIRRTETELRSKDGRLVGRPDFVSIAADEALLREYKSGPIREPDGQVMRGHIEQLKFYSHLVFENHEVERVVCLLESLTGDSHEMVIERKEASEFAEEALRLVDKTNARLLAIQDAKALACPSRDACRSCDARIVCIAFKEEQDRLELTGAEFVLEGIIKSRFVHATAPIADVVVSDERRKMINVLTLPAQECDDISVEASYVFMNLRRHGGALVWDQTSRVFWRDRD